MEILLRTLIILIPINILILSQNVEISPVDNYIIPFHLGPGRVVENKHTFIHYVEIEPHIKLLGNNINYL